jgi:hypothetical protein
MKTKMRTWATAVVLVAAAVGLGGCAFFVVGAAAGAGTVAYYGNELRVTRTVSLDRAWEAANAAVKEMEYIVIPGETRKDATGGVLQARTAKDQPVRVELTSQSAQSTEVRVRVGTLSTPENKKAGQMLYEKMSSRLPADK